MKKLDIATEKAYIKKLIALTNKFTTSYDGYELELKQIKKKTKKNKTTKKTAKKIPEVKKANQVKFGIEPRKFDI